MTILTHLPHLQKLHVSMASIECTARKNELVKTLLSDVDKLSDQKGVVYETLMRDSLTCLAGIVSSLKTITEFIKNKNIKNSIYKIDFSEIKCSIVSSFSPHDKDQKMSFGEYLSQLPAQLPNINNPNSQTFLDYSNYYSMLNYQISNAHSSTLSLLDLVIYRNGADCVMVEIKPNLKPFCTLSAGSKVDDY